MAAITAAVVGVIGNLALWFSLRVWFRQVVELRAGPLFLDAPRAGSVDAAAVALSLTAAVALFRFRVGVMKVLAGCAAAGIALRLVGVGDT